MTEATGRSDNLFQQKRQVWKVEWSVVVNTNDIDVAARIIDAACMEFPFPI
jgi:uncharacterized metal-binding protein YceD (DUF177 family)